MDELQAITTNISRFITLTEEEGKYLASLLKIITIRKKQCIVQPEFVCRYRSYVYKGALRSYFVAPNG
jgi:hypothetical protein